MPGGGGEVRAHYFTRAAATLGRVTLLSLCGGLGQQPDPAIRQLCESVIESSPDATVCSARTSASGSGLKLLLAPWQDDWRPFVAACVQHGCGIPADFRRRVFTSVLRLQQHCFTLLGLLPPLKCLAWHGEYQRLKQSVLDAELQLGAFDAIWVEDVFSWPFAADLLKTLRQPPTAVICNTYNIETALAMQQAGTATSVAEHRLALRTASQLKQMEKQAYGKSSLTIVCSEQDRAAGAELVPAGRFTVVENGVDLTYFQRSRPWTAATAVPRLLLTGTFTYGPNTEAARYFAAEILPEILRQIPQARFVLAGRSASMAQQHLKSLGLHVEAISDPADMRPVFESAAVFVVPLLVGGGTRLKILEAMAMGIPVVSTTIGAEGLGVTHGQQLLLADSPADMAAAVVPLERDADLAENLRSRALEWVQQHYDWQLLCARAISMVQSAIGGAHPR